MPLIQWLTIQNECPLTGLIVNQVRRLPARVGVLRVFKDLALIDNVPYPHAQPLQIVRHQGPVTVLRQLLGTEDGEGGVAGEDIRNSVLMDLLMQGLESGLIAFHPVARLIL